MLTTGKAASRSNSPAGREPQGRQRGAYTAGTDFRPWVDPTGGDTPPPPEEEKKGRHLGRPDLYAQMSPRSAKLTTAVAVTTG